MAEDDKCILNDDSNGDRTEVRPPKILTYRSISSNGSSEKSFSGFSQSQNSIYYNGRINDDLEIIDKLIRDAQPWKEKRYPANSSSSTSEDRVFVRRFQPDLPDDDVDDSTPVLKNSGEVKAKEDPLEIVDEDCARSSRSGSPFELVTVEGLSEHEQMENSEVDFSVSPSSHESPRSSIVNRQSFPVMRPSVQLIDIMNTRKSSSDGADISSKLRSAKGSASPRSALQRTPKSSAEVSPAEEDESELEDERNFDGVINGSGTGVTENETEGRPPKRLCSFNKIINSNDYGRLVWGKTGSCRPWPAVIVNHVDCGEQKPLADKALLLWFGDHRITEVHLSRIKDFVANFGDQFARTPLTEYNQAVLECLKECRALFNLEAFSVDEEYLRWGEGGLNGVKNEISDKKSYCSVKVQQYLRRILKMKMRERSSSKRSFFTTSSSESGDSCDQERREWKSKAGLLTQVRKGTKDIETLCIACDQVDCKVAGPHPYFFGGTCQKCKEELEDITSCAPDGSMYCLICGSPGELIVCDDGDCERVFCTGCVELFVSPKAVREIMEADPWLCFLCNPYDKSSHGLLKPRSDWQEKIGKHKALVEKINCITTNTNSLKPVIAMNDNTDFPWITELEKILGFQKHDSDIANLNPQGRQALLGRSCSVQVIDYILKPLTRYFALKKEASKASPPSQTSVDLPNSGVNSENLINSIPSTKENITLNIRGNTVEANCESDRELGSRGSCDRSFTESFMVVLS